VDLPIANQNEPTRGPSKVPGHDRRSGSGSAL